ncbi:MAG: sn-glycerol-3-phosphate ABC transporter ATP-binding protein UgpC [Victivallales bacterium]|nr:sn-glycerol-3-phosphate ABC transporter ATP-binding protein UgpC [Victivallales bacterium]
MAEVVLTELCKSYEKGRETVHNLNLTVHDKEFMVLVGPSGCGKSTTLRMIAGLEEITSGTISIGGQVVNKLLPKDRDVAMVFQNYALYPHKTVRENLAFSLKLRKTPKEEIARRVAEAAEMLGLNDYLDRLPKQLSGGQRQRVAVGRAIVRNPAVFLFDEPLSNLDAKMRSEMRTELLRLHQRLQCTMIYVTHDQVEAMTMGDRICVMKDGEIQQTAPPMEVYEHPANQFVAGFIGSPPMNFFQGRILVCEGKATCELPGWTFPVQQASCNKGNVIVGIRPEHFELDAPDGLHATIEIIEHLGGESLLRMASPAGELVAKTSQKVAKKPGDSVILSVAPENLRFFTP